MQTTFYGKKIDYDGSQLHHHFAFDTCGIVGDACFAFVGACDVKSAHMVDLADKRDGLKIASSEMLHFIVERFDTDLEKMILNQRIFVSILMEELRALAPDSKITRKGNDLFEGEAKINISIATATPVSTLMHVGVNISSKGTPVKTKGLKDFGIETKILAENVMKRYSDELESIKIARCKVKPL